VAETFRRPVDLRRRLIALARLALGVAFDPADLLWYPVGVLPLLAVHMYIRAASR
jgi:hypothetical protein